MRSCKAFGRAVNLSGPRLARQVGLRAAAANAALTGAILAVPLVAMQFTPEVDWGIDDFIAAGALLFSAGMAYCLAVRRTRSPVHRIGAAALVLAVAGTVWAELAVGLFE